MQLRTVQSLLIVGLFLLSAPLMLTASYATTCGSGQTCGTLYFTIIGGSVDTTAFTYDSVAHTVSFAPSLLASGLSGGADGIIRDSVTHNLMVGVNCGGGTSINEISPTTGYLVSTISTPGVDPSHIMADVAGNAWYSADGCGSSNQGKVAFGSSTGSAVTLTGDDSFVNTIVWNSLTNNENLAYYTSGACCAGGGHFGTLDTTTMTTTCVKVSGECESFPGAHGEIFDPYTGDIIIVGGNHITQIDPTSLSVVSDLIVPGFNALDQGAVDGQGHLFVANNGGSIFFLDYSTTKQVNNVANFAKNIGCCFNGNPDDVAPLVGPGSTTQVPQFPLGILTLFALAIPGLIFIRARISPKFTRAHA